MTESAVLGLVCTITEGKDDLSWILIKTDCLKSLGANFKVFKIVKLTGVSICLL